MGFESRCFPPRSQGDLPLYNSICIPSANSLPPTAALARDQDPQSPSLPPCVSRPDSAHFSSRSSCLGGGNKCGIIASSSPADKMAMSELMMVAMPQTPPPLPPLYSKHHQRNAAAPELEASKQARAPHFHNAAAAFAQEGGRISVEPSSSSSSSPFER